jgi:hypothetical protein
MTARLRASVVVFCACALSFAPARPASPLRGLSIRIDTRFAAPPRWAVLERQLLTENVPACGEFFRKYFDDRGYLQCVVRWGANDGPDDAFENFNRWPELHALGASDEISQMFMKGHEGLLKQYTEARTTVVPIARDGMYYKEFIVQSDWMHHGEGLQLFNRMGLSVPADRKYQERAKRFAGFYMGEDPQAPNYDPVHKIIRSMQNGSRGPMLRKATPSRRSINSWPTTRSTPTSQATISSIWSRRRYRWTRIYWTTNPSTRSGSATTWTPGWIG